VVEIPQPARPEAAPADVVAKLPERLRRLLALVAERGPLATSEYVRISGFSLRTGLRDLNELVELGLVERTGSRRGARYRMKPSGGPKVPV
jgi:DeoR/GlpR family transcriptional regulator of sugar metabolism